MFDPVQNQREVLFYHGNHSKYKTLHLQTRYVQAHYFDKPYLANELLV